MFVVEVFFSPCLEENKNKGGATNRSVSPSRRHTSGRVAGQNNHRYQVSVAAPGQYCWDIQVEQQSIIVTVRIREEMNSG